MEERRNNGGEVMQEKSWTRDHGGEITEEKSWRRNSEGEVMEEKSWRRNRGRKIMEEKSWRSNHGAAGENSQEAYKLLTYPPIPSPSPLAKMSECRLLPTGWRTCFHIMRECSTLLDLACIT